MAKKKDKTEFTAVFDSETNWVYSGHSFSKAIEFIKETDRDQDYIILQPVAKVTFGEMKVERIKPDGK